MEIKRRALGRGLEELFNNEPMNYEKIEEKIITSTPKDEIVKISLDELRSNPYQPRTNFDQESLNELAASIKEHGVFQPIIAKKSIKGYEIIAGERRVKASKMAGLKEIPAIIRDFTDEEMMEIALLENLQREDLNAVEEATAYKQLLNNLGITQEELARRLGKSRSHITNMIGILTLPDKVLEKVISKDISAGHARMLSKLEDQDKVEELASRITDENLSVRQLEEITTSPKVYSRKNKINKHVDNDNEYSYIEEKMIEILGTKVKVKKGKIEITFANNNDLNRILEILKLDK